MPESEADANGHREAGDNGRNEYRPVETTDLQGERATGRTGGEMLAQESIDDCERFTL
jgi:hypothetical protein